MAIGARILSNNLSGQTVNVTFLPTTGGTINLGTQTIPFNNITSYPYGVYQIYVPLYGYTYELTVSPPSDVKSLAFLSKLVTNNNQGEAILNFDDITAEILDLDVDYTGWYINSIYPLTDSGYGYYFGNNDTCDLQWAIFVDSTGKIMDNYQTNCNCDYDYDNLGGKWITFTDYYNGVFKYFNGTDVYTYNVDPTYQYIYPLTGWDGVMSNDKFVVRIENYTANTANDYIVDGAILTPFGDAYDLSYESIVNNIYFDGNFIVIFSVNYITNEYLYLKIFDGNDGTILENIDLTSYGALDSYGFSFYGKNKSVLLFWNSSDPNVDYVVFQYNGNTNVLNTTTHNRLNYSSYPTISSQNNIFPNDGGSEAFAIILYTNAGGNGIGNLVTYCDVLYMLSGDTTIQTLTFQNSGIADKTIRNYASTSNNIFIACDNGDEYASILSITNTGVTYHNTNLPMSGNPQISDIVSCGNGHVSSFFENNSTYDVMTLIYITEEGVLGDLINGITLTGAFQRQSASVGDVYFFRTYSASTYYINSASTTFQTGLLTGNTFNTYYPTAKFRPNFIIPGLLMNINYVTGECQILSSSGLTSIFTLPANTGFDVRLGDTKFIYTYSDDISGLTNIHIYDFNFNLLFSSVTEFTSYWSVESCGDNFTVIINENNRYYIYLIKDTSIVSTSLSNNDNYYTYNDYVWWD